MRRLNVRFSQIEECIRTSMFAVDQLPASPPLQRGETLLLQLVKADAAAHDLLGRRIQFALIFDRSHRDVTGAISREHWPNAGKTWRHILYCSETIPCFPFSLESLRLSRDYGGQTQAMYIGPADEAIIRPYLKGEATPDDLRKLTSVDELLLTIRNYDRVVEARPPSRSRVGEHERTLRDPWAGNALKLLYDHSCQICLYDFEPQYGVPYADTRFLTPLDSGGLPVSRNMVVICPNHDAIIGAAHATFDARSLAFTYPNGLVERLRLRDHLLN